MADSQTNNLLPVLYGVNHITATVEFRDQVLFSRDNIIEFSGQLLDNPGIHEVVIVSTCNRSEVYCAVSSLEQVQNVIETGWVENNKLDLKMMQKSSYFFSGSEATRHLFNVVASLDSMVVGENQILGQVKTAYELAHKKQFTGFYFNSLFQSALRVGKRVRSETRLNEGALSISFAAVDLAKKVLGKKLEDKTVGVVGSGEMGELTASHFKKNNVSKFLFFNRSTANAEKLAAAHGGETRSLEQLSHDLKLCDIIVSATGASEIVIHKEAVLKSEQAREGRLQFFIDIAAPRDIDPEIQQVDNTFLFTIDDLKNVVGDNKAQRQESAARAAEIISHELELFEAWYKRLNVVDTIRNMKTKFEAMLENELNASSKNNTVNNGEFERFGKGLINKILHTTITGIKKLSEGGDGKNVSKFADIIFDLEPEQKNSDSETGPVNKSNPE